MEEKEQLFYGTTTVGERGQVVIPVEAREKLGIKAGDKLLVLSPKKDMLVLAKPGEFEKHFEHMLAKAQIIKEHIKKAQENL